MRATTAIMCLFGRPSEVSPTERRSTRAGLRFLPPTVSRRARSSMTAPKDIIAIAEQVEQALPVGPRGLLGATGMRDSIHRAAIAAAWEQAAIHVLQALAEDTARAVSLAAWIGNNVQQARDDSEYPEDARIYQTWRGAEAGDWIRAQPKGQHERIARSLAGVGEWAS